MVRLQGFTYPVRSHFLENILEITGHRLTPYNQIDDYGQEKSWKMQKQTLRKRKSQIASAVEVCKISEPLAFLGNFCCVVLSFVLMKKHCSLFSYRMHWRLLILGSTVQELVTQCRAGILIRLVLT